VWERVITEMIVEKKDTIAPAKISNNMDKLFS
jgi:hypothetical protein